MLKKLARTCFSHLWLVRVGAGMTGLTGGAGVALDRATIIRRDHGIIQTVAISTWSLQGRSGRVLPRIRAQGRTAHVPTSPGIESALPHVSVRMPGS